MIHIPSLTQMQLEVLQLAKEHSGESLQLSFNLPVKGQGKPSSINPPWIQEMIDLGLLEVQESRVYSEISCIQQQCWLKYCSDLEMPSIYAWELWRNEFIDSQKGSTGLIPGEEYEDFSYVWVQEIKFRAVSPS